MTAIRDEVFVDKLTGEPLSEDDIDWNTRGRPLCAT